MKLFFLFFLTIKLSECSFFALKSKEALHNRLSKETGNLKLLIDF